MDNKSGKGKNIIIILLFVVVIVLIVIGMLILNGTVNLSNDEVNNYDESREEVDVNSNVKVKNNLTVMTGEECTDGCTKSVINSDENQLDLYIDLDEIRLGNISILKFEEGSYSLEQVSVYDDIIITLQRASLSTFIVIYDFNGNELKRINIFNDDKGRLFYAYVSYSENEMFNVSDDGLISFVGSEHHQGAANTYLDDGGMKIDLCTQGEYKSDDSIVSGVFELQYLGEYLFSEIKYVSTRSTVKDLRNCS